MSYAQVTVCMDDGEEVKVTVTQYGGMNGTVRIEGKRADLSLQFNDLNSSFVFFRNLMRLIVAAHDSDTQSFAQQLLIGGTADESASVSEE